MKEREGENPILKILIDEAESNFYSRETTDDNEVYTIYHGAEDAMKRYKLDPEELFPYLSKETRFTPFEIYQISDIDQDSTWRDLFNQWAYTIIGREALSRNPILNLSSNERLEKFGELDNRD